MIDEFINNKKYFLGSPGSSFSVWINNLRGIMQ